MTAWRGGLTADLHTGSSYARSRVSPSRASACRGSPNGGIATARLAHCLHGAALRCRSATPARRRRARAGGIFAPIGLGRNFCKAAYVSAVPHGSPRWHYFRIGGLRRETGCFDDAR